MSEISTAAELAGPLEALATAQLRRRYGTKWSQYPRDVLPMWVAEMDTPLAEPIATALIAAVERGDTGYAVAGRLPEAFADFSARRYGWRPEPSDMRLVPDVMYGIVEMLELVTGRGAHVVVNTPAYPPYFYWLDRIGRQVVVNPLALSADGYRLDLDRLERDFADGAEAYLLCSPHNPTGLVFSHDDLVVVAELAQRHQVRVIADEIFAPLTFPESRHIPFGSLQLPAAARSITLVAASKGWNLAGLKAALAVPGAESGAEVAQIHDEVSESAGLFGVIAAEAAFTAGEPWLAELLAGLDANRRLLHDLITEQLPDIGYRPPQATYLAWLDCRALPFGDDPAAAFLQHGRLALAHGPDFGAAGRGFARLNLAAAPERISDAVARMTAVLGRSAAPVLRERPQEPSHHLADRAERAGVERTSARTQRVLAILSAPSNLGLRPPRPGSVPGCAKAPEAFREAGLYARLLSRGAVDAGAVLPGRYVDDADPAAHRLRNQEALVDHARRLASRLHHILDAGNAPLVLGGDCSLLVGAGFALARRPAARHGLVHIDGHTDFRNPGNSDACSNLAGEDLAAVVGRHWPAVANLDGRGPYFGPSDVAHLGCRDDDEHQAEAREMLGAVIPTSQIRRNGVSAAASLAGAAAAADHLHGYWLHLDVDVLDPEYLPAVDSPTPGGLTPDELVGLLQMLAPGAVGAQVTIFDPDLDPNAQYAKLLASILEEGLSDIAANLT